MEETGTDLIEVEEVPGELDGIPGTDLRKEDDLRSKALTEKMIYLMGKISEYGYLTRLEVELIYANQTHAYKVLGTLRSKELIGDFETERQPKKAVYLRPKGYRTLEKFGKLRVKRRFLPQHFKPFIFVHRMACARVGLVLEGHPLVREFMPESLLWERAVGRRQKLCDGEFWYCAPDAKAQRVGLEVELTLKNRDKLDESLSQLRDRDDLDHVWWVCGDGTILRALRAEVMRRYWCSKPRHLFCLMSDFLEHRQQARLSDAEGREFKIDPAEPTLRTEPTPAPPPAHVRTPEVLPAARAEVLPQPQPAPRAVPEPDTASERYRDWMADCRPSLIDRVLAVAETVVPVSCLGVILVAVGWLYWTELRSDSAPQVPEKPWIARAITNRDALASIAGAWQVKRLSLRSRAGSFRLSLRLENVRPNWCGLTDLSVADGEGKRLASKHIKGGAWIWPNHLFEDTLTFRAPGTAARILVDVVSDGWECPGFELPLDFR